MTMVAAVSACYLIMQAVNITEAVAGPSRRALCLAALAATAALQYFHTTPRAHSRRARYGPLTLAVQGALILVPGIAYGIGWGALGGFLAGSALMVLPSRAAWPAFAGAVAFVGAAGYLSPGPAPEMAEVIYTVFATTASGLVLYSLTRLSDLVAAIHSARKELARMAVARERLRFARDLHDLLGYSLSSITLKSELISRLIRQHPDRAYAEIMGVLDISRQALSDVREVARGYRDMSLLAEAASVKAVLEAAQVETGVRISCGQLSQSASTVLATVLREGVTNLLRHSRAARCSIDVAELDGWVRLKVVNDGADASALGAVRESGTGLDSLTARVTAIGGRLTARHDDGGTFLLVVEVPTRAAPEARREKDEPVIVRKRALSMAGRARAAEPHMSLPRAPAGRAHRHSQPASRASRIASTRLRAFSLKTIVVR